MHDLIILIPTYNEINNLNKILKNNYNFLIIDDCSNDGTEKLLKKKKIEYIKNLKNIGYEKSLIKGLSYLKNKKIKYVCTLDGDGEHPINKIKQIYSLAKKKKIDLIICNRKSKNRLLENILSILFKIRFGLEDPLSGMKMYYMPKLKKIINKIDKNSFLVDVVKTFVDKKYKIFNYEISTKKKLGESKVGHNLYVQLKILKLLRYII
jgi:glycosyltransferase involved in cell wall biosynthesis